MRTCRHRSEGRSNLRSPPFSLQAHVFGGNDADAEAVDVGHVTKIEQKFQARLIEQLVDLNPKHGSAVVKDDTPFDLEDCYISDAALGDRDRHVDLPGLRGFAPSVTAAEYARIIRPPVRTQWKETRPCAAGREGGLMITG